MACGSNILNSRNLPMTRSTWILNAAILLDSFTSSFVLGTELETEGGRTRTHFLLQVPGIAPSCQNAWLIKRKGSCNWTYCDFRRAIVNAYLQKYGRPPMKDTYCGVPVESRVSIETRLGGTSADHMEVNCTQRRCGLCHQCTRKMCSNCNIGLHLKCWYKFHNK